MSNTCPSFHKISGSGTKYSAYYSYRKIAESNAASGAETYARILAGLRFNGFVCPDPACSEKSLKIDKITITSKTSSWSLLATVMWLASKYQGRAEFTWEATITCNALPKKAGYDIDGFIESFKKAVKEHSAEVWTLADGWVGNLITGYTWGLLGDGCSAWGLWMVKWLYDYKNKNKLFLMVIEQAHIGKWPLLHQIVIVRFPDGTVFVLDPWRDKEKPVHRKDDYEKVHGPLKPGFSQ